MTENKRYSAGTLAKWYYSQTNVISDGDNEYYLRNKESVKDFNYNELLGTNDLLDELNKLSDENEQLKQSNQKLNDELQETMGYLALKSGVEKENEQLNQEYLKLKHRHSLLHDVCLDAECERDSLKKDVEYLEKENEQLKSELSRYKEVNRLDIWKSSYSSEDALITELQNKCDKKQEHIVILENKIRRMREAIHKLEWLATHRNGELIRENEQLKKGMIGVVDRYIKNVECNPPSSARTYIKIKGALVNIREDLRNLIGDVE